MRHTGMKQRMTHAGCNAAAGTYTGSIPYIKQAKAACHSNGKHRYADNERRNLSKVCIFSLSHRSRSLKIMLYARFAER